MSPASPDAWLERLEPVLVKDLRAALRGRAFGHTLIAALAFLTLVSIAVFLMRDHEDLIGFGEALLNGVLWAAQTAMGLFVPLWAFVALGQELEGDRYDQLVLTRLSGWRIVWGKFLAALVLLLLLLFAALPFAFSAFVFGGVGAGTVAGRLAFAFLLSAECVAAALCVSSFTRVRWARALLLAGMAFVLFWLHGPLLWITLSSAFGPSSGPVFVPEGVWALLGGIVQEVAQCGVLLAFAGGRLAHPEESRSTPLRYWSLLLAASLLVTSALAVSGSPLVSAISFLPILLFLGLVLLLACTEPEALPRATRVPRSMSTVSALLRTPFLGGGGRGALYALVLLALLYLGGLVALQLGPSGASPRAILNGLLLVGLPSVYILLPAGLLATIGRPDLTPGRKRLLVVGLWCAFWFGCAVLAMVAGDALDPSAHFLNPGFVEGAFDGAGRCTEPFQMELLALLALLGVLVNVPRMVRGVCEVLALRAQRVEPAGATA